MRTIWKRKTRIVIGSVLAAAAGVAIVRSLPAIYLAETVIVVDSQKIPEKFVAATVASDLDDRIAAIRETLLSGGELKSIIDEFGLYREARKTQFEEEILDTMRKNITITPEAVGSGGNKRTANFRIGYQGTDPVLVMRVANRLTDLYVEQNLKTRESEAQGTSEFLDTQLTEAKKQLDTLEASVSAYKLQHNGELPQQEQSIGSALSRLQIELESNRDAINRTQQTRVILEGNLTAMEVTLASQIHNWEQAQQAADGIIAFNSFAPANQRVAPEKKTSETLQNELDALRAHYSDEYPDVVRKKAELERVKAQEEQQKPAPAVEETTKAPQSVPAAARASRIIGEPAELEHTRQQIAGFQTQLKASDKELEDRKADQVRILRELDSYQRRMERLPIREQEMAQVTRDYEMSKANYKSLLDKKMNADMSLDMEKRQQSERFTVVERAQVPQVPIKPKRPLLYGVALAAGLVIGLALGFAAELRQNVLLGEWELPAGTPVLARVPYFQFPAGPVEGSRPGGSWFKRSKAIAS